MRNDDGLDQLSSGELHDLAISRAKRHLEVRFFSRSRRSRSTTAGWLLIVTLLPVIGGIGD